MKVMSDINIHLEDKRESRHFFVFLWIMYALVYMTKNCFSGALSAIVDEGSLTLTQATLISASFYIVYTPLQILGGIVADKYSPEKMITIGLVGGAVCNTVIFFNQNFYVMLGSWVFNAIIQFALWPSVFKIMSSQLVRSDRSKMIFYMSFSSSGGLITTYIISALLPHWKYNFLVSAIILVLCAVVLLIYCKHLNPLMKKDYVKTSVISEADGGNKKMSTVKLFLISGFFTLLPAVLIRTMVENGTKTLSPTMLMQSYESISPSTGNLLSIFIIIAGVLGTLLVKLVLFPRIIKNEVVAYLMMMFAALPFTIVLRFVGDIPAWLVILSLSMISMSLSATHLLTQYFNMLYIPYGKNGTAAGILNAAASLGMVFQYCVFGPIADNAGSWVPVTTLWIVMVSVGIAFCAVTVIPAKKFRKKVEGENK